MAVEEDFLTHPDVQNLHTLKVLLLLHLRAAVGSFAMLVDDTLLSARLPLTSCSTLASSPPKASETSSESVSKEGEHSRKSSSISSVSSLELSFYGLVGGTALSGLLLVHHTGYPLDRSLRGVSSSEWKDACGEEAGKCDANSEAQLRDEQRHMYTVKFVMKKSSE